MTEQERTEGTSGLTARRKFLRKSAGAAAAAPAVLLLLSAHSKSAMAQVPYRQPTSE